MQPHPWHGRAGFPEGVPPWRPRLPHVPTEHAAAIWWPHPGIVQTTRGHFRGSLGMKRVQDPRHIGVRREAGAVTRKPAAGSSDARAGSGPASGPFPLLVKPGSVSAGTDRGLFGLLKMLVVFFFSFFFPFHFCLKFSSLQGRRAQTRGCFGRGRLSPLGAVTCHQGRPVLPGAPCLCVLDAGRLALRSPAAPRLLHRRPTAPVSSFPPGRTQRLPCSRTFFISSPSSIFPKKRGSEGLGSLCGKLSEGVFLLEFGSPTSQGEALRFPPLKPTT